jgi:hypothetical protein
MEAARIRPTASATGTISDWSSGRDNAMATLRAVSKGTAPALGQKQL